MKKQWVTGVAIISSNNNRWSCGPPTYLQFRSCTFYIVNCTEIRFSWTRRYWKSFDNCVVLTLRLTGAASCRSGKGIWRLTTIPTPDSCWILLIMFSWTPPQFAITGSIFGAFLELNERFVKQTPPTRYRRRFATRQSFGAFDDISGWFAREGCRMLGETQATTGFKPRVLWIGEDVFFSKKKRDG